MPKRKFSKYGDNAARGLAMCEILHYQNRKMLYNFFDLQVFCLPISNSRLYKLLKNMPSGKTHDAITFLLAAPTGAAALAVTQSAPLAAVVVGAFLFGGLMFGPDLDTHSTQYTRWSVFRFLWYPYQAFFAHRSRWSHGLIFGTFIRIVYFTGAVTLLSFVSTCIYAYFAGETSANLLEFTRAWVEIGENVRARVGENTFIAAFAGLWLGAASHTVADSAGTFIKTGKV